MERNMWTNVLLNVACLFVCAYASPRVTLTVPVSPVRVDGMLSLRCQIWDADDTVGITITRIIGGKTVIMALNGQTQQGVDERFFLAVRRLSEGGSVVHFVSIINVEREDEGEYYCNVFDLGTMEMVTRDSAMIDVAFFPDDTYPVCSSTGTASEGKILLLNCTTEDSNPTVNIKWRRTSHVNEVLKTTQHKQDGFVYSELSLKLSMRDNQVVYLCEISHRNFPGHLQTCHIGPLNVIADPMATQASDYPPQERTIPGKTDIRLPSDGGKTHPIDSKESNSANCKKVCSTYISSGMSYWVIGTIAACGLAVFFLFIGIILAVKLNRRMNSMPSQASYNDDIYSELEIQSRRDHNRVYMTLAKIDNPVTQTSQPKWELEGNYTGTPIAVKP